MKKNLLLLCFAFLCIKGKAQITPDWVSLYNCGVAHKVYGMEDMVADKYGNVYEIGYLIDTSYKVGVIIKYNTFGVQQWLDSFNYPGQIDKIKLDKQGNIYTLGKGAGDFTTRKYTNDGVFQWEAVYNGIGDQIDMPFGIATDDSLNVYITGEASQWSGHGSFFSTTIKYNPEGVQQWVATFELSAHTYSRPRAIVVDSLRNVYITGFCADSSYTNNFFFTIKYDPLGNQIWAKKFVAGELAGGYFIDISKDGYIYTGGVSGNSGYTDYLCIKYDADGNEMWSAGYNPQDSLSFNAYDVPSSMKLDDEGNVYMTGTQFQYMGVADDYCTIKIDKNGLLKWHKSYNGGNGWDDPIGLVVDKNKNVYVSGYSDDSLLNTVIATLKYDSLGNLVWTAKYTNSSDEYNKATSVCMDSLENLYVAGYNGQHFSTLKYNNSTISDIKERILNDDIAVYPNPTTNQLTIELDMLTPTSVIEIKNVLGQTVCSEMLKDVSGKQIKNIDVTNFSNGIYFLVVKSGKSMVSKKFVKN